MKIFQGALIFFGTIISILSILGLLTAPVEQAYLGLGGLFGGLFTLTISPLFGIESRTW